ncbi:hypothetical protein RB200_11530 [Streptomyces sp. PmtG]
MRYVLAVVLLATCALFAGVCHGPHGPAAAPATLATPAHQKCPGPAHGEHAATGHPAAVAAQPADREGPPDGGGGESGGGRAAPPASPPRGTRPAGAEPRAGPCGALSGAALLIALGVDRN